MNQAQRKQVAAWATKVSDARAMLEEFVAELEQMAADEREKFDNMPEGLQQAERGQAIEAAADALDSMLEKVVDAISSLEEAEGTAAELEG